MIQSPGPTILFVVDAPNWAHDYKTRSLQRTLGDEYQIRKRFQSEVTEADLDAADLILIYYWLQFDRLRHLEAAFMRNRRKLLVGVCSHFELEGQWHDTGLDMLRRMARGVFANNLLLYHELRPLVEVPVFYTPNGVDTDFFRPMTDSPPPACRETLRAEKLQGTRSNPKGLLSSLRHALRETISKVGVGRPTATTELRVGWAGSLTNQGTKQRGVRDLIVPAIRAVKGARLVLAAREKQWRGRDAMLEFYRSIDVYLCASRTEGTPNPCLEAAACGLPVVTTRVGNMPELIQNGINGLFVERTVADITNKISHLRDNPRLRDELGRGALASIQAWDWKHQAGNYRSMFQAALNGESLKAGEGRDLSRAGS